MSDKLNKELKDTGELDLNEPGIEDLYKQHKPKQWKIYTVGMWLLFAAFVGTSIFNYYNNAAQARSILESHQEITAQVVDVIQILEDGSYTDYSVDLEASIDGIEKTLNLTIAEDVYEEQYASATEIPIIFVNDSEYNLKSYYERRSNMFSNVWSILFGYLVVFILLYFIRHFILKFTYK